MKYTKENFQRGVKVQMAIHQFKVRDVVERTGLKRNTISLILNSKSPDMNVRVSTLRRLCELFNCTPNDLFQEAPKGWDK